MPQHRMPICEADLRVAFDRVLWESLAPASLGLGGLYALYAVSQELGWLEAISPLRTVVTAGTAVVLLSLGLVLGRRLVSYHWAHPLGAAVAGLILLNSLLPLRSEPQHAILMLLVIGAGSLLLSARWLAVVIAATLGGWGLVTWHTAPSFAWMPAGFGLCAASVLAGLIQRGRVRMLARLEQLQRQHQRHQEESQGTLALASRVFVSTHDSDLQHLLQLLGKAVGANRAYIFQVRDNGSRMDNTHEWCDEHTASQIDTLRDLDTTLFPWWRSKLAKGETIVIPDVDALPREAEAEKSILQRQHIRSLLVVPIQAPGGELLGFIGFDDTEKRRTWSEANSRILRVAGEILARSFARTQVEKSLQENERKLQAIFRTPSDIIATLDLEGVITRVNRAVEYLLGYTPEELIGKRAEPFLTPESMALVCERNEKALRGESLPSLFELQAVHKNGTIVSLETNASFLYEGDKPVGMVCILRDVTLKKELEQQRADFLAMLTHDIKNPLGVILVGLDLLLEEAREHGLGEEEGILQLLRRNALMVHSLATNYLDSARIEDGSLTLAHSTVDLKTMLRQVGQRYEAEVQRRGFVLRVNLETDLPSIEGDSLALERVFMNLLDNAMKFTPEHGEIMVSATHIAEEVVVTVADTGPGITPEELPRLFDKYRTAKQSGSQQGTGLGLFIAKTIVEAHGGRIEVKSAPGQGACFYVFLPLAFLPARATL